MKQTNFESKSLVCEEDEFIRFLCERGHRELIVLIELGHSEVFTDELINEFEEWQKGATER